MEQLGTLFSNLGFRCCRHPPNPLGYSVNISPLSKTTKMYRGNQEQSKQSINRSSHAQSSGGPTVEQWDRRRLVSLPWRLPDPHQGLSVQAPRTTSQLPKRPWGTGMPSEPENSEESLPPLWTYHMGWKKSESFLTGSKVIRTTARNPERSSEPEEQ